MPPLFFAGAMPRRCGTGGPPPGVPDYHHKPERRQVAQHVDPYPTNGNRREFWSAAATTPLWLISRERLAKAVSPLRSATALPKATASAPANRLKYYEFKESYVD